MPTLKQAAVPQAAVSLLHLVANTSAKHGKPRVGESSPNLGTIPLFPNERDTDSAKRAYKKTLEVIEAEGIKPAQLKWLRPKLILTAQRYWVEHERDTRATSSDMKDEVTRLQRDLAKAITRLSELPLSTRQALNAGVRSQLPKRNGPSPNYVTELHDRIMLLHGACEPISSKKNTKVPRSNRFEQCGADLWAVREKLTGKKLPQTFELQRGAFVTADAAFIHAVMTAIDDKVTPSQVQDGLRKAAQAKNKRK